MNTGARYYVLTSPNNGVQLYASPHHNPPPLIFGAERVSWGEVKRIVSARSTSRLVFWQVDKGGEIAPTTASRFVTALAKFDDGKKEKKNAPAFTPIKYSSGGRS